MDKIVQIKYARGLRYAKNKICLILGIDEGGTVILARSSSLSWKIPKDLISHLVKCNFTSKESKKLNLICGRYIEPILLKRSCFLVEPSKTATFSDLVKVVGKRIKNEKHKFGVLYENGKLESHWLTNEEINNKTR